MSRALGLVNHNHSYVHDQGMPASIWTITHNLGRKPSVTCVDALDVVVMGRVEYIDENNLTITFSAPFSGKAYLN